MCEIKHCKNKIRAKGYCSIHYHTFVFRKKRPLYLIWSTMIQRCHNPKHVRYHDWGGRGIVVCDQWLNDYFAFERDMGIRPSPFHQLDRIDNNGNYEPGNCRWATASEQAINRRVKSTNTSGVTGVSLDRKIQKWKAYININKKQIVLGSFHDFDEAVKTRLEAEERYYN